MRLDVITILIALGILCSGFSIAMLLIWRFLLPKRSLMLWGIGIGCYGAGVFLVSLRGITPDFFTIIIANLLIAGCYCIVWWGVSLYRGTPPWTRTILSFLIVFIALYAWFTYLDPLISARHVVLRIFIFFIALGAALTLLKEGGVHVTFIEKVTAWMFMLDGTFKLFIVAAQLVYASYDEPLHQNMITGASAMMSLIGITSWGLAVILMMLEKTTTDLRESEGKHRILFETANDAIFLMDKNIFIGCNAKTLEMFDCTREQIIGQSPYRFSPEVQPDGRNSMEKAMEKINAAIGSHPQYFEWQHSRYDGTLFDAEINLNAVFTAGQFYLQAIVRDITKRKQIEEALQESAEVYRNVFENHAAVKLLIDPDTGSIIEANEAAINYYGWSHERLKQMKIQEINALPPEEVRKEIEKARTNKRIHFEFQHRREDGSIRDVEVFSSKIKIKGKTILHSIIHDITERKQAEQDREKLILALREALSEVKALSGLLPICASCKKIRDDKGYWNQIESYIKEHSDVEFSHGICPECMKKLYPDIYEKIQNSKTS